MSTNSLGWLGTGRMGAALAARLIDAGERVTVWNRTGAKTEPLVARGARAVDRITDLSSAATSCSSRCPARATWRRWSPGCSAGSPGRR